MQISLALSPTNPLITGGGPPFGFRWTTYNGVRVTYLGRPVFDDGHGLFILGAL